MMKFSALGMAVSAAIWVISGYSARAAAQGDAVSFESQVRELSGGFQFTEGPAVDKDGNIYFTDIPGNKIHKWSVDGKLSTFIENSEGANGLYFDKEGNLAACLSVGKIASFDPQGKKTILAAEYNGKPFNSPNDLWVDPNGGVYFTDPRYGSRDNLPQDGEHVYYLSADRKNLVRVIADMTRPNGVLGTPDGKILYVADQGAGKTYSYKINPDGTLSDKKLFAEVGSDGLTLDSFGNVYLTGDAVFIYNPSGKLIGTIKVPQTPSNMCFSKDKKTLFITARKSLYSVRMQGKNS
jgi:gluconolactonase